MAVVPRERQFGWEVWLRFSWAVTYRLGTLVGAAALAVLAFSQGSQWWDIVGAVLTGSAIADVISVPTTSGQAPYTSEAGFQSLRKTKSKMPW